MSRLDLEEDVRRNLLAGERVVWSGQPAGHLFTASDLYVVPFSLLWCGFAFFWEGSVLVSVSGNRTPIFVVLWGIPFVLIGLYMVVGRFFYKAWIGRRTMYAVTNRRALVLTSGFGKRVQAAFLDALPGLSTSVGRQGTGNITFGSYSGFGGMYANVGMGFLGSRVPQPLAFYDVPEVNHVAAIVEKQREALRPSRD